MAHKQRFEIVNGPSKFFLMMYLFGPHNYGDVDFKVIIKRKGNVSCHFTVLRGFSISEIIEEEDKEKHTFSEPDNFKIIGKCFCRAMSETYFDVEIIYNATTGKGLFITNKKFL